MADTVPYITVAICTYDRYDFLSKAIDSVLAQDLDPDLFDLMVIDNTPKGEARAASAAAYADNPRVDYVTEDTPGLANARNVALARSTAEYVLFLDDDAVAQPGWLRALHDTLQAGKGTIGVIGGRVLPDFAVPRPAWLHETLAAFLSIVDQPGEAGRPLAPGELIVGANIGCRRKLALQLGGFDVALGRQGAASASLMSGEEDMLIRRVIDAGRGVFYCGAAVVHHHIPAERLTRDWFRRRAAWQGVGEQKLYGSPPAEKAAQMWELVDAISGDGPGQLSGLYRDTDDPEVFLRQVMALRHLTRLLLSAGRVETDLRD